MTQFEASLFGRPVVCCHGQEIAGIDTGTAQRLLFYLLLFCDRRHAREKLALAFWPDSTARTARKNLRQALWQLGQCLPEAGEALLAVDGEWVGLNAQVNCLVDTAVFEGIFNRVRGVHGHDLSPEAIGQIKQAISAYKGDLLEGWPEEWCLYERERLKQMYLALLDKLVAYSEARAAYEDGIYFGSLILRHDQAHERTHRRLMRMQALAGDRTAALRQFGECQDALLRELNVAPAQQTLMLYEQIRDDVLRPEGSDSSTLPTQLPLLLEDLQQLRQTLRELQRLVDNDIRYLADAI